MLRHHGGCFYSVPFWASQGRLECVLTYDDLNKPTTVKQVLMATIVIWFWATRAMLNCTCVYEFHSRCVRRFYFVVLFHDNVHSLVTCVCVCVCVGGGGLLIGKLRYSKIRSGPSPNIKIAFKGKGISIITIRESGNHLIFIMVIPLLVRWYFYIERSPRFSSTTH